MVSTVTVTVAGETTLVTPEIAGLATVAVTAAPPVIDTVGGAEYTLLFPIETAPVLVSRRPETMLLAPEAIAPLAIIVPTNVESAPIVPAPLTCQNTFCACAPLISTIWTLAPSESAPPIWKMNMASS